MILRCVCWLLLCGPLAAHQLQIGGSTRAESFEAAYAYDLTDHWAMQAEYIDEGRQPDGIKNVNKPVNLDALYTGHLSKRWDLRTVVGLTSSRLSHNGCSVAHGDTTEHIEYRNHTEFTGYNLGVGAGLKLSERLSLVGGVTRLRYQQVDKPAFESYTFAYAGVRLSL